MLRSPISLSKDSVFFIISFTLFFSTFLQSPTFLMANQKIPILVLSLPVLFFYLFSDIFKKKVFKWLILLFLITLWVVIPTIILINARLTTKPFLFVSDSPIQIEAAIKFLLSGQNPYTEDYLKTDLVKWPYYQPENALQPKLNPALFHLVYLPFNFLSIVPLYLIWNGIFGWFDVRIFYLSLYLFLLPLITLLVKKELRFSFLSLFALNPFFAMFIPEGSNDVLTIFLLILVFIFTSRKKYSFSAILVGLSLATKQTAWIFLLVYLPFLYFRISKNKMKEIVKFLSITAVSAIILIVPFFLCNPRDFIDDTLSYISGGSKVSSPISGFGFSILYNNLIPEGIKSYPSTLLQLIFGGLTYIFTIRLLKREHTLNILSLSFSLLLLVVSFFSRYFLDSHLGVVIQFIILAYFINAYFIDSALTSSKM